ncbi:hypothetical protein CPC16_009878 [Podila verticillata]|nr:hypothetical protein CPC16_009878 [Podila verticillata]
MADAVDKLARLMSWESFGDLLTIFWENLTLPNSDNSTIIYDLVVFHASSDPLISAIRAGLGFAFACWFQSMATGNHSWVDKLWSILPVLYAIHFSIRDMLYWPKDTPFVYVPRVYIATALILIWGARLTYNFARKGGYGFDSEDYRWPYLAERIPTGLWLLFNIFFICLFQNLLLVAMTAPVYTAWRATLATVTPLNWIDLLAVVGFVAGLALETMADEQQWVFQEGKKKAIANKETLTGDNKRGFLTQGLFKYSRHPNFFGEMTIWWSVYLFSVAAAYPTHVAWINPSIVGVVALTLLFQISTTLTEHMASQKYPAYKLYKKTTSRLIPLPTGTPLDEVEKKSL